MKVLDLLEELNEIIENASTVPLSKKVMVDPNEISEIIKEIQVELPDEIQQAQWIKNERQRILDEAKEEYNRIISEAQDKAEHLIIADEITIKAKTRAESILKEAKESCKTMKMSVLDYSDGMLENLETKTDEMKNIYFDEMYNNLRDIFERMYDNLAKSRDEVKEQIVQAQQDE